MKRPLVSIGMSLFNCEKTLDLTIASILTQCYGDWELIAIDDGSKDRTLSLLESLRDNRVRVIADGNNLGLPARLNQAVSLARGKYFARMDGDDVMYPDRLEKQVAYLETHPEVDLLGGGMVVFRGDGIAYGCRMVAAEHDRICSHPWSGFEMAHPTWMGRTEWFRQNPYREDAYRMEDKDLLFRTCQKSRFANLPDVVLGYREDDLSFWKILPARRNFCKVLMASAGRQLTYINAARGIAGQAVRTIADVVAITTGLNEKILRHRARPVPPEIRMRWDAIWQEVNSSCFVASV